MPNRLAPLSIAQLRARGGRLELSLNQPIAALAGERPVRGWLRLQLQGELLEVEGAASTTVRLRCDRCLAWFERPLQVHSSERLDLRHGRRPPATTAEPQAGRAASGSPGFDPEHWLFEQLNLQLPPVNRCGARCPGPSRWSSEPSAADPRWAALRQLRPD